jgi:hypothetical protein
LRWPTREQGGAHGRADVELLRRGHEGAHGVLRVLAFASVNRAAEGRRERESGAGGERTKRKHNRNLIPARVHMYTL